MAFFKTNNLQLYFSFKEKCIKFIPKFYQDIRNYWSDLHCIHFDNKNATFITDQTITIQNEPSIWNKWTVHSVVKIKEILKENVDFLNHDEINEKFHLKSLTS